MIEFSISADSNIGYLSPIYQQSTQGKMWLAQAALGVSSVPGTQLLTPDNLGGIEKGFSKRCPRARHRRDKLFILCRNGTPFVFIEMDSTLPAEIVANRFIERVANNRAPLADQVMYCVCKRIVEFDNYIFNSGTGTVKAPILSITVNL